MLTTYSVTHLLEHTAALEAEKAALPESTSPQSADPKKKTISPLPTTNDSQLQLRSELAEALRSNGQLQTRVKAAEAELLKLRAKTKTDSRNIEELERERIALSRKIRDRGDEHKVKGKLLEVCFTESGILSKAILTRYARIYKTRLCLWRSNSICLIKLPKS